MNEFKNHVYHFITCKGTLIEVRLCHILSIGQCFPTPLGPASQHKTRPTTDPRGVIMGKPHL